ncbi:hypothetical protein [Amycolatopsis sp. CA-126428]|uniref:hypothetical protein n=1 Tax=Amycolatopsis sp. CA-126428 TaxID=2073158 RepID=UPI0011B0D9A5|nr:hypothetical protein [Amycolatopsis sp. CA-126428]
MPYAYLTGIELVAMQGDHVVGRAPVQYDISHGDLITTSDGRYFAVLSGPAESNGGKQSPQLVAVDARSGQVQVHDCLACESIAAVGGPRVLANTNDGFLRFSLSESKPPLRFPAGDQFLDRLRLLSGAAGAALAATRDPFNALKEAFYVVHEDGVERKIAVIDRPEAHYYGPPAYRHKFVIGRSAATILPSGEARFAVSTAATRSDFPCAVDGKVSIFSSDGLLVEDTKLGIADHAHILPGIDGALAAVDLWWDNTGDLHAIVVNDTCGASNVGDATNSLTEWRLHDGHWLPVSGEQTRTTRQLGGRSSVTLLPRLPLTPSDQAYDLYLSQGGSQKKVGEDVIVLTTMETPSLPLQDPCKVDPVGCPPPSLLSLRKRLYSAPVPSLCEHPAGTLVDGALPGIPDNQGVVELAAKGEPENVIDNLAIGDITSDGVPEMAAVFDCSQGGVSWPEYVVVYSAEEKILGAIDLGDVALGEQVEHAGIERLKSSDDKFLLAFTTYNGAAFCVKKWSAELRWDGHSVTMQNLLPATNIPAVPC